MFKDYLRAGGDSVGPYGFECTGINWSNIGDIVHVVLDSNGSRHTMIIVGFTSGSVYGSRTRDQIYVSAHTGDCNNVLLTTQVGSTANTLYTEA